MGVAPLGDVGNNDDDDESHSPLVTPLSSFQGSPSTAAVEIPTQRSDDETGLSSSAPSTASSTASFESSGSAIPVSRLEEEKDDDDAHELPSSPTKFYLEDSLAAGLGVEENDDDDDDDDDEVVESTDSLTRVSSGPEASTSTSRESVVVDSFFGASPPTDSASLISGNWCCLNLKRGQRWGLVFACEFEGFVTT